MKRKKMNKIQNDMFIGNFFKKHQKNMDDNNEIDNENENDDNTTEITGLDNVK
jgi:hypothetical protein